MASMSNTLMASTENIPPNDWQLGMSASESMAEMFHRKLWTDVQFRCHDQDSSDAVDRLFAHRVVLAARSPVFQAMFFGSYSDKSSEIVLDEIDSESFKLFLLYLYCDQTDLTEDTARAVLQIAHKYQVINLVKYCCDFLMSCLNPSNACETLELAMFFEENDLLRTVANFIDKNAEAVLKSDGFLCLSHQCLLFLLKGDTFLVDETKIFDAAMRWAANKCEKDGRELSSVEQKKALGEAFYYLRVPTMTLIDFSERTLQKGLYTLEEHEKIVAHIAGIKRSITSHSVKRRVPLTETIEAHSQKQNQFIDELSSVFYLTAVEDVALTAFRIPTMVGATELWRSSTKHQYALSFEGTFAIPELDYTQPFTTALERVSETFVSLDPPVLLKQRDLEYTVRVNMKCRVTQSVNAWLAKAHEVYISTSGNVKLKYSPGLICVAEVQFENVSNRFDLKGNK